MDCSKLPYYELCVVIKIDDPDFFSTNFYLMKLEELRIYQMAMELGEEVWKLADAWSYFIKDTIGKQLVRSADSVAANISKVMVVIIVKKI